MQFRRILPIALLVAVLPLMGLTRCSEFRARGGCGGPGGEDQGGNPTEGGRIPASANYTFNRTELGTTYNTGTSGSSNYKASSQLGWFLSEGVTLSDSYKTFHPMSQEILQRPPTLETKAEENPGDENPPEETPP